MQLASLGADASRLFSNVDFSRQQIEETLICWSCSLVRFLFLPWKDLERLLACLREASLATAMLCAKE